MQPLENGIDMSIERIRQLIREMLENKKPLFCKRSVLNGSDIVDWYKMQGIYPIEQHEMHVTVAYSRSPVDFRNIVPCVSNVTIKPDESRCMKKFGQQSECLVLSFNNDYLQECWKYYIDSGCSYDFPEYCPHVTISYNAADVDIKTIAPYMGLIELGPEEVKELDLDWKPSK